MKNIIIVSVLSILSINLKAQSDWFSFDIPPLDTSVVEFYPIFDQAPIESEHFVTVNSDGHFEVNGKQIRFWGTPCSRNESGALSKEEYPALIKELKKNGVNIFRFHLWDSESFNPGTSIFGTGPGTRILDDDALDRIDYLIYLMKENGIYAYIDLLCDRHYTEEDGVYSPDSTYNAAKIVNFFDPTLIELQKEFAHQLLTHVNPYTGNSLVNEPTMAVIDIVNEGWFLHSFRGNQIQLVENGGLLSHYHFNMLTNFWNDYLLEKYITTDSIKKVWGLSTGSNEELIANGGFESGLTNWNSWGPAEFTTEVSSSEVYSGTNSFHVSSTFASANNYDCQLQYNNSFFESTTTYKISFWAKSDAANTIGYTIQLGEAPWTSYASTDFTLTTNWQKYNATFTINKTDSENPYLYFNLGLISGDVWIDGVSIIAVDDEAESFELLTYSSLNAAAQRGQDQVEFYLEIQDEYYQEMYSFIKSDLGVQIPVTGSNYLVGIPDIYLQNNTDFIDNHGYWDRWGNAEPISMISETDYYNPILGLFAGIRTSGKPLTVSEYNYQSPNPFSYEALFFLAGYGSFHDADMLIVHQLEYTGSWDFWNHGFNSYQQISFRALQPTFAYAYRNNLISSANDAVTVNFTYDDVKDLTVKPDPWTKNLYPDDYPFELAYQHKLITDFESGNAYDRNDYPATPSNPYLSDTEQIEWDNTGLFSINTPQLCAFVGELDQFTGKAIGNVKLADADKSAGFTLLALDSLPLDESKKMMMTITTQMKNTGMITDGYEVIDYGNYPRIVEATSITINLITNHDYLKVIWLNESGHRSDYYEIFENNGNGLIPITINTYDHPGVWFGVEQYVPNAPVADFSADITSGQAPLAVQFTDASTNATSWSWDFNGDGTEDSQEQNPGFEYTNAGVYSVSLTVTNSYGEHTTTKSDFITVNDVNTNVEVTFRVDMQNMTVSSSGVFLRGSFNSWDSNEPLENNGSVYYSSIELEPGTEIQYKFVNGNSWESNIPSTCGIGDNNNRHFTVPETDTSLEIVCFNSCEACGTTSIEEQQVTEIYLFPNPAESSFMLTNLPVNENIIINVYDTNGQLLREVYPNNQTSIQIELFDVNAGIYFINITGNNLNKTMKIIKKD